MTIVSSGTISINSLVGEYGGSAPHAMNEYYRGGSLVSDHSNNSNVPTSGTIDLQDFYGANNTSPSDLTAVITPALKPGKYAPSGYSSGESFGSVSDSSINVGGTSYTLVDAYNNEFISYSSKLAFSGGAQPAISHITISSSQATSSARALTWNSSGSYFTWADQANQGRMSTHNGYTTTLTFTAS